MNGHENKGSWYGYVTACKDQLLIGGVKHHQSARFETSEQASNWCTAIVFGNCQAGRTPSAWGQTWSPLAPEITAKETE